MLIALFRCGHCPFTACCQARSAAWDGTRLVDQRGETVVLRGMSFGWHNLWPWPYKCRCGEMAERRLKCTGAPRIHGN